MPERYNACCERVGSTSCDAGPQTNPPRESASSTETASPWRSCVALPRPRVIADRDIQVYVVVTDSGPLKVIQRAGKNFFSNDLFVMHMNFLT